MHTGNVTVLTGAVTRDTVPGPGQWAAAGGPGSLKSSGWPGRRPARVAAAASGTLDRPGPGSYHHDTPGPAAAAAGPFTVTVISVTVTCGVQPDSGGCLAGRTRNFRFNQSFLFGLKVVLISVAAALSAS